jgi:hypothetical protein
MRLVPFLAACVVFSFGFVCVERRLSVLEATFAQTARMRDHEMNEFNHNWMQPVFTRILALEGASKGIFDIRKQSRSLEGRLKRHEIAVEQKLKVYQESFLGEFRRLKEEIFMAYVDKRAHEMLKKEVRKSDEYLGKMAKWVQEQIQGHAIKTRV